MFLQENSRTIVTFFFTFCTAAYVADWKVSLDQGKPHEVKDHSTEVSGQSNLLISCWLF
jgi:hypothetical protein